MSISRDYTMARMIFTVLALNFAWPIAKQSKRSSIKSSLFRMITKAWLRSTMTARSLSPMFGSGSLAVTIVP